jgi:hypothetical protein
MPGNEDIVMTLEAENDYYNNINENEVTATTSNADLPPSITTGSSQCDDEDDVSSVESNVLNRGENKQPQSMDNASVYTLNPRIVKHSNDQFKYESFLRLRNVFYLCLLLKKNPSLRLYRHHYIEEVKKQESKVQPKMSFFNDSFERFKRKMNWKSTLKGVDESGAGKNVAVRRAVNVESGNEGNDRGINASLIASADADNRTRRIRKTSL